MFNKGDIVKIKAGFTTCNNTEFNRYIVVDCCDDRKECVIEDTNPNTPPFPQLLVTFQMIEILERMPVNRLTEKHSSAYSLKKTNGNFCDEVCIPAHCNNCPISEAIHKLAMYEDREETKNLGCDFCNQNRAIEGIYVELNYTGHGHVSIEAGFDDQKYGVGIEYCPMCGKRLI